MLSAAPDYSGAAAAFFLNEKRVTVDKNKQFAINMIAQVVGFVVMMGDQLPVDPVRCGACRQ